MAVVVAALELEMEMGRRWGLAAATLPEVRDLHGTGTCHHAGHGETPVLHSNKAACDGLFCYP